MYMKAAGMYSAIQGTCFNVLEVGTPVYRVLSRSSYRGMGVSKNQGVAHGYIRDSLTYLLTYFNAAVYLQ